MKIVTYLNSVMFPMVVLIGPKIKPRLEPFEVDFNSNRDKFGLVSKKVCTFHMVQIISQKSCLKGNFFQKSNFLL